MNVDLMLKVADHIERNPENYCQMNWCGTACCIAGHAVVLGDASQRNLIFNTPSYGKVDVPVGEARLTIPDYARLLLDIDELLAHTLFSSSSVWPPDFQFDSTADRAQHARKAVGFLRYLVDEYKETNETAEVKDEELVLA